jgi:anti-sigma B factor antagonist
MIKPSLFEIDSEWEGDRVLVSTTGELDLATSPLLEQETRALVARGARHVTIDLSRLTFVDSSGLRVLILLHERSLEDGWQLSLTAPSEQARAVFRISGADEHLPFVEQLHDVSEGRGAEEEEDPPFVEESLA